MFSKLPQSNHRTTAFLALVGAVLLAALLFLIIPVSQALQDIDVETKTYREVPVVVLPPPDPPMLEEERQIEETSDTIPELEPEPPQLELSQLELSLNPGIGEALSMSVQGGAFGVEIDVMGDLDEIFDFADLAQPPTLLNGRSLNPEFPWELERRGIREIKMDLEILIDKKGKSHFQKILSTSHQHPKLEQEARRMGNQARFTVTIVEGQPVKVRAKFPITLSPPR